VFLQRKQSLNAALSERPKRNDSVWTKNGGGKRRLVNSERLSNVGLRSKSASGKSKRSNGRWKRNEGKGKSGRPRSALKGKLEENVLEVMLDFKGNSCRNTKRNSRPNLAVGETAKLILNTTPSVSG
jgi:hypothetical protein